MAIISSLFVLVLLFAVYRYLRWFVSPLRKIPGPFGLPIFGNLIHILLSEPGAYSVSLALKYGKVFRVFLFSSPQVVVADPHLVKYVLNNPEIYGKKQQSYKDLAKLIGNGLITIDDEKYHKYQRGIIGNAFSYANLKSYFPIFTDKANKLALYLSTLELKNEKGESLSRTEIIDNCKTFLLAGTETSSACLSWTIWLLCQYPEIQERLHNEIVAKIGNSIPTFEQIESISYLNNVVKESLRIRPPVTAVGRFSEQDDFLGDYFVPKGTLVVAQIDNIQNYPEIWKNATVFDPDRWNENDNDDNEDQKMWIPFLVGARNCIGSKFALLEIKAILCILVTRFRFWMPSDHPRVKRGFGVTSKLLPYLKVNIEKRK